MSNSAFYILLTSKHPWNGVYIKIFHEPIRIQGSYINLFYATLISFENLHFNVLISTFIFLKKSLKGHNPQKYNLYLLYIYR